MKSFLFCVVSLVITVKSYGQELVLLKQMKIGQPVAVSTDRYAHIYIADKRGNLQKYDSAGTLLYEYTPQQIAAITSVEGWQAIQVFVFYRDLQKYTFLNRFLTTTSNTFNTFNAQEIGFVRAATPASDETIWIFDDQDFSLKKYNPGLRNLLLQVPLELVLRSSEYLINYMREYQNMLFMNDKNSGILVFDNFGNYKKKLPFTGIEHFSFRDNELYFLTKNSIQFFNIYTLTTHTISLPTEKPVEFCLVLGTRLALLSEDSLSIYQFIPN